MNSNRLAGHTLPNEGRIFGNGIGNPVCCGPAVCSCGATSEVLHGANARKRWHREHKAAARTAPTVTQALDHTVQPTE